MSSPQSICQSIRQDRKALAAQFLLQVQVAHVRTRDRREPTPLHFDSETGTMVQYPWPVDEANGERLAPTEFLAHRLTHELQAPCCLCAFLEEKQYTEARIGIAETVNQDLTRNQAVLNGEIVAACAKQQCGYFLCLERFYPLRGLNVRVYPQRQVPFAHQGAEPPVQVNESFRAGDGLFQVMSDAVIRGKRSAFEVVKPRKVVPRAVVLGLAKGIPEQRFWATFVQCLVCKEVIFRETFGSNHVCNIQGEEPRRRRFNPYTPAGNSSTTSRLRRTYAIADLSNPGPAPTTRSTRGVGNSNRRGDVSADAALDADTDSASDSSSEDGSSAMTPPAFDSDADLPTLPQLFEMWRQEDLATRGSD